MKLVMSTSALIGRSPIEVRRFCSHCGDGPFLTPAHQAQRKTRTQRGVLDRDVHRAGEFALDRLDGGIPELAHVGSGEIAGDAMHAGAILPVRRQIDLEQGIAEAGPFAHSRRQSAHRRAVP